MLRLNHPSSKVCTPRAKHTNTPWIPCLGRVTFRFSTRYLVSDILGLGDLLLDMNADASLSEASEALAAVAADPFWDNLNERFPIGHQAMQMLRKYLMNQFRIRVEGHSVCWDVMGGTGLAPCMGKNNCARIIAGDRQLCCLITLITGMHVPSPQTEMIVCRTECCEICDGYSLLSLWPGGSSRFPSCAPSGD